MDYQIIDQDGIATMTINEGLSIYEASAFLEALISVSDRALRLIVEPEILVDACILQILIFYKQQAQARQQDFYIEVDKDASLAEDLRLFNVFSDFVKPESAAVI